MEVRKRPDMILKTLTVFSRRATRYRIHYAFSSRVNPRIDRVKRFESVLQTCVINLRRSLTAGRVASIYSERQYFTALGTKSADLDVPLTQLIGSSIRNRCAEAGNCLEGRYLCRYLAHTHRIQPYKPPYVLLNISINSL